MLIKPTGSIGVGTTTPSWLLQLASSTVPQLVLSDPSSLTNSHWAFRNAGGNLYLATSSGSTFATSSLSTLSIISGGANNISGLIGVGSTTPWAKLSVEMGPWNPAFSVSNSGSSSPAFVIDGTNNNGYIGIGTSTPNWALQITNANANAPQLVLSDVTQTGGQNKTHGFLRFAAGNLYIGTSSDALDATSTLLTVATSGALLLNTQATSSFVGGMSAKAFNATNATSTFVGLASSQGLLLSSLNCSAAGQLLQTDSSGNVMCGTDDGSLPAPAGSSKGVQFYSAGSFGANEQSFVWDNTNTRLGLGTTTPWAVFSASSTSSASPVGVFDQRGTGNILQLQTGGVDKAVFANNGGLTINGATSDIVKSTNSTGLTSDFNYTGSTFTNTAASGNDVVLSRGSIPSSGQGTASSPAATTTAANVYSGSHVVLRDDGGYIIIHGGSTFTASVWNGNNPTMQSYTVATGAVGAGGGALSVRRPDGRYLLVHGASTTQTTIFDPFGTTTAVAGPTLSCTAADGSFAIQRDDGKYVVYCGGSTGTAIYDPVANTSSAGPTSPATIRSGAHALRRIDGSFLIFAGGNSTSAFLYTQNLLTSGTGANSSALTLTNAPTVRSGAFSIQLRDGTFLIISGAANVSTLYNPATTASTTNSGVGTFTSLSVGPATDLTDGAQAVWRQDGSYLLLRGGGQTATTIIDPSNVTVAAGFTAGPTLATAIATSSTVFLRPDGTYAITRGGGSTAMDLYDMGYVVGGSQTSGPQAGVYESDCMVATGLNANSTLGFDSSGEGRVTFEVKTGTGSCSGSYKSVAKNGDLIDNTITTQNRVQIRATFKRGLPYLLDQEWGMRKAGITRYLRNVLDPVLHYVAINNTNLYKRTTFTFGNSSTSPSSPIMYNITNKTDGTVGLSLVQSSNNEYFRTLNANSGATQLYDGAFATSTSLKVGVASSSVVMKRPDGKYVIIAGSTSTPNAQVYDPDTKAITNLGTVPAAYGINVNIGVGVLAFKRTDGKFLITLGTAVNSAGSGATSTTVVYDPVANTFATGPNLTGTSGRGALAIPLPNGRVLIIHGNYLTTSSIYDPLTETMMTGPNTNAVAVGAGSFAIPLPNGTFMVNTGVSADTCSAGATTVQLFDPYQMTFRTMTGVALAAFGGPGATLFQRSDGTWLYNQANGAGSGSSPGCLSKTTTSIINATNGPKIVAGPVGIFGILFPAASQAGPTQLILLVAVISLGLAVMNVLPIPALDGGRWFVTAAFRTFKKELTKEREEKIQTAGFMTLMALVVLVTVADVGKLIK
jgi:membrane-associated protease RseP (regulator of RpoE activity)